MSENKPQDPQAEIEHARAVLQEQRERLLSLPNVVGVGIGLRQTSGQLTETVALVVLVQQKLPLESLAVNDRIPSEIEGVPVDVQETGSLSAASAAPISSE